MSVPRYDIVVLGAKQVEMQLTRGAIRASNMRSALTAVRLDMFRVIRMTFQSQGRRGGGSWKRLEPATLREKINKGLDPRILYARHTLVDSLTERKSRHMRTKITKHSIILGTDLPYADTHQFGDEERGIRARPFIKFTRFDRARWAEMCMLDLVEAMR